MMSTPPYTASYITRRPIRDLRIYHSDTHQVTINSMKREQIRPIEQCDVESWRAAQVEILERLQGFVQTRARDGFDLSGVAHTFLEELREVGASSYTGFFPQEIREEISRREGSPSDRRSLNLTFTADRSMGLLWELVYVGDPRGRTTDPMDYWGFRHALGQVVMNVGEETDQVSLHSGILSAIHSELTHCRREAEHLKQLVEDLGRRLSIALTAELLDESRFLPNGQFGDLYALLTDKDFDKGLIHFACHCDHPPGKDIRDSCLLMTAGQRDVRLRLGTLEGLVERHRLHESPIIFLNACKTNNAAQALRLLNFPSVLLNLGAGGVIATACTVPDEFASQFSGEFYTRLLNWSKIEDEPLCVAEVLLETRRHFLKYNNPLGLAYSLHAPSFQRLSLLPI